MYEELGVGAEATAALMAASSELGLGLLGREQRSEVMRSWQGALLAVSVMASFTQSACPCSDRSLQVSAQYRC